MHSLQGSNPLLGPTSEKQSLEILVTERLATAKLLGLLGAATDNQSLENLVIASASGFTWGYPGRGYF